MPNSTTPNRQVMTFFAISFGLWFIYVSLSLVFAANDLSKMNKRIQALEDLLVQKPTT
jgi:cell division protein FtsB